MAGSVVERQLTNEQASQLGWEWAQTVNVLAGELTARVRPHLPLPLRRGHQRSMLIVGCGGRGAHEVAAVGLSLGPAAITAVDIDKGYVESSQDYWRDTTRLYRRFLPEHLRSSTVEFMQADIFSHAPSQPYDVVFAYGIHPRDVVDAAHKGKRGVDAVIDLVNEQGGIVVFTKKSLGVNKDRLAQELQRRKQERGDIGIVEETMLVRGDYRTFVDDQYMWVVKRHSPVKPTRRAL